MTSKQIQAATSSIQQAVGDNDLSSLSALLGSPPQNLKRDDLRAYALTFSCETGNCEAARYLLAEERADVNQFSGWHSKKQQNPPLVLAVMCYSASVSSLESVKFDGNPLSAIQTDISRRIKVVKTLFEHKALLKVPNSDRQTALSHVAHLEVAKLILENSSKADFQEAVNLRDGDGCNALMAALEKHNDSSIANLYIDNDADIYAVDGQGRSSLMYAVWKNHYDVVRRLIRHKDLVCIKDHQNRNVWHHVAMDIAQSQVTSMLNVLSLISENEASVNDRDDKKRTPLHSSAIYGTLEVAKAILEKSPNLVDARGQYGKTPLHFAAAYGHAHMVKLLLEHNAKVDSKCNGQLTPLHLACSCGSDAVMTVKHLLEHGAAIESQTEESMTPLHKAAAHGQLAVVKTLLMKPHKADINAECEGGWTPLHLASCGRHTPTLDLATDAMEDAGTEPAKVDEASVVRMLLSAGADVNQISRASKTALHLAAESGRRDIVEALLEEKNIKLALKDDHGNTALLNAARNDQEKTTVQLLAPWTQQHIASLPSNAKQIAQDFDADIFDFHKDENRPHRYQVPIYNLLYAPCGKAGAVSEESVSTKPEHSNDGCFRWIHLPANNLSWAHTLLTKHFIENDCSDVEGFRDLERSLNQMQYRGHKVHARHMRPACSRLSRRVLDEEGVRKKATDLPFSRDTLRVNSIDTLSEKPSRPPMPSSSRRQTDLDLDRYRPESKAVITAGSGNGEETSATILKKSSTSSQEPSDCPKTKICLFMPYLNLENKWKVDEMHNHIDSLTDDNPAGAENQSSSPETSHRDKRLLDADLASGFNEYRMHIRRTLDQYRYKNVNTSARDDDQVVWRHQNEILNDH